MAKKGQIIILCIFSLIAFLCFCLWFMDYRIYRKNEYYCAYCGEKQVTLGICKDKLPSITGCMYTINFQHKWSFHFRSYYNIFYQLVSHGHGPSPYRHRLGLINTFSLTDRKWFLPRYYKLVPEPQNENIIKTMALASNPSQKENYEYIYTYMLKLFKKHDENFVSYFLKGSAHLRILGVLFLIEKGIIQTENAYANMNDAYHNKMERYIFTVSKYFNDNK